MDDLSHILWSYLLFSWTGQPWLAILFGVLPDLLCFTPAFVYGIFRWKKGATPEENMARLPGWMRNWAEQGYNVTHNLFTTGLITAVALATNQYWLLAWTVHVLMDIPSHSKEFYATPMFWPVSDFTVDGIPWSDKRVMIPNVVALVIGYGLVLIR